MKKIVVLLVVLLFISLLSGCFFSDLVADQAEEEREFIRGACVENVYASEYANLMFSAPEDWQYASYEEMAEIMGVGLDVLQDSDQKVNQKLLELKVIYDMMAVNSTTGSSVSVLYENLALSLGGLRMTEEEYLDICQENLESIQELEYEFSGVTELQIGTDTYKAFIAELPDIGVRQYYCARKVDKYMLCIIISIFGEDDVDTVLGHFSAFDAE
jgi:hypothetical protein